MKKISFTNAERKTVVGDLQYYFSTELDQDLGNLAGELLLDFISEKIGSHYYNRGLRDAQAAVSNKMDDIADAIYDLEQPTGR